MNWRSQCAVVIPCFNEAATVGGVVQSAQLRVSTVVVVDDGSSDATGPLAQASGAAVLRHARRRGKGAALRTGLAWVAARQFQWALLMDGDGQHVPEDIPAFFRCAQEHPAASLIVGNRMGNPSGMPWLRRVVNGWMSRQISNLTGHPLPDSQCGFRLVHVEAWSRLELQTAHFEAESELLTAMLQAGAQVEFVPVQVLYGRERTKIRPVRDTLRWCCWWWRTKPSRTAGMHQQAERCCSRNVPTINPAALR